MARIRTIKPEFPQSESIGRISREARLCFILLWTQVDDSGRLRGASRMLASLLFPYDDDAPGLIDSWLTELEAEGCIRRYTIGTDHFLDIPKWLNHQKIDKPSPSRLPPFGETSPKPREPSSGDLGPRTIGPRTEEVASLVSQAAKQGEHGKVNGASYDDPAVRKQRWVQKIATELERTLPTERAEKIILGYQRGEQWARTEFERVDKRIKERRVNGA